MHYLVCENCGEYYKLEEGESPDDYSDTCKCGGKLEYYDYIPLNKIYKKCPRCGNEDNRTFSLKPLGCFCLNCNHKIFVIDNCPICGYEGKLLRKDHSKRFSRILSIFNICPNCGNSFGIYNKIERSSITEDRSFMIRAVLQLIVMLFFAILIIRDMFFK